MFREPFSLTDRRTRYGILALIGILGAFHLATLRAGHDWSSDVCLYAMHARNLLEGRPYAETGYLYNPHYPSFSPRVYPPGLPVLIAPVIAFAGLHIPALKIEMVLFFIAGLLAIHGLFRRRLTPEYLALLILFIGWNPVYWDAKDRVLSDLPFLFFSILALWLVERILSTPPIPIDRDALSRGGDPILPLTKGETEGVIPESSSRPIVAAFILALAAYAAYALRSIGIVLPAAIVLHHFIRRRLLRPTRFVCVFAVLFALLLILQTRFAPSEASYAEQLRPSPGHIYWNLRYYFDSLPLFWSNGYWPLGARLFFLACLALAVWGYGRKVYPSPGIVEVYLPLYCIPVLLHGYRDLRFLLPLLPLGFYYTLFGLQSIKWLQQRKRREAAVTIFAFLTILSFAGRYSQMNFGPIREGITKPETQELFEFIRENTSEDATIVFRKPRVLAFYANRRSAIFHEPLPGEDLADWFDSIGADYLVVGPFSVPELNPEFIHAWVAQHSSRVERVFSNRDFEVYRLKR